MSRNIEGEYPEYNCWTVTAVECYKINCDCRICTLLDNRFSELRYTNCKMKLAVSQLKKKFGGVKK